MSSSRYLIIRLSSIGDILLTTPFIRVLRRSDPSSKIDFMLKKQYEELLINNHNISELLLFDISNGLGELRKWRKEIRKRRYTRIFDLHGSARSRFLTIGVRNAPVRRINKRIIPRLVLINFGLNTYKRMTSVTNRYFETASDLGLRDDRDGLEMHHYEDTGEFTKKEMNGRLRVVIAPGAGFETKIWLSDRYAEFADKLVENHDVEIILVGSKQEESVVDDVMSRMKYSSVNTCGATNLLQAAAVIDNCDILVTNDSGLMHIGVALKKKVLAIFGSTTEELGFFPYATVHEILQVNDLRCRPCSAWGRHSCPKGHFKCMNSISVDMVYEGFLRLHNSEGLKKAESVS